MPEQRIQVEREVGFMFDPQALFVSLVDRGANQIPFRVVKRQEKSMNCLHSIIAKAGTDPEAIRSLLTDDAATLAKFDAPVERGSSVSFVQVPRDMFKAETLELVVLDKEAGVMALQGELVEQPAEGIVTKFFSPKRAPKEVMAVKNAEPAGEDVRKAYVNDIFDELDKAWAGIIGVLGQSKGDPRVKFAAIESILDNLESFISETLQVVDGDSIAKQEAPAEEPAPAEEAPAEDPAPAPVEGEQATAPEDGGVAKSEQAEAEQGGSRGVEAIAEPVAAIDMAEVIKAAVSEALAPVTEELNALKASVVSQAETVQKMQATPVGVVKSCGGATVDKDTAKTVQKSVFSGLIFSTRD